MKTLLIMAITALMTLTGCRAQQTVQVAQADVKEAVSALPKARIYLMSGDYRNNVPLNLNASGEVVSFPAPTDIRVDNLPIQLADGYLLDTRGINENSVFMRYTYADYSALRSAPTVAELKKAIIPGARVTKVITLPMTLQQARADIPAVNSWIKKNLK